MAHQHLLQPFGCMEDSSVFVYGLPVPDSTVWEGLYIDDHVIITMILDAGERPGLDRRIVDASHRAYAFAKLPVSISETYKQCLNVEKHERQLQNNVVSNVTTVTSPVGN